MSEPQYETLEIVGLHEPGVSIETDAEGHKYPVELPGFYHVGVMVRGVFQPIYSLKAGGLLKKVERAKQDAAASTPAADTGATATPPAGETTATAAPAATDTGSGG